MTTQNLQIPYLLQNVAQPEIPENIAKDIIDAAICGILAVSMPIDLPYTIKLTNTDNTDTYPHEWHYSILNLSGNNTTIQDLILPDGYTMRYVVENNTGQDITFKTITGTGIIIPNLAIYSCYSDGINIKRIT